VGEAGLVVIVVGNVFYLLTGLASLQGLRAGTTTFAISRAPFGPNGNRLPSFLNWITQVGLEIEGIAFIVLAAIAISGRLGFLAGTPVKVIFILVAVAIQAVLPTLGHAAVLKVLRWLAIPFVVLFAIMAVLATPRVNLHGLPHGAGWGGRGGAARQQGLRPEPGAMGGRSGVRMGQPAGRPIAMGLNNSL
jgi:nucleobase:cation symporter-1, NCS1 family